MNCPLNYTEREGLDLLYNLPSGEYYINCKKAKVGRGHELHSRKVTGVGISPVPKPKADFNLFITCGNGSYYPNWHGEFVRVFGINPEDIRAHHISKTPPQCCPLRCCCPQCCPCEMTVRFHAPEPTGKELLREILKPGMTVKICDEVLQVASNNDGSTIVKPAYRCGCFLLLVFSPTRFSEKDFKLRVGKSVESITRSDIEILYDPTEAK